MCGIFGVITAKQPGVNKNTYRKILHSLFLLSESRGKEASGFALSNSTGIRVFKTPFPSSDLVRSAVYKEEVDKFISAETPYHAAIGHSRLVTDGNEQDNFNNQPVIKAGAVAIHNGIIVNSVELWQKFADEKKETALDSELIPTLIRRFQKEDTLKAAVKQFYSEIYGLASTAILFNELDNLLLATNNGSLYYCISRDGKTFVFASEKYILVELIEKEKLQQQFSIEAITQLPANTFAFINLQTLSVELGKINDAGTGEYTEFSKAAASLPVELLQGKVNSKEVIANKSIGRRVVHIPERFLQYVTRQTNCINKLKRCTKCILPETFPYIEFDNGGVCNYCRNYAPLSFKGKEAMVDFFDRYRSKNGSADCILSLSGGRDSSYVLHYITQELNMRPVVFSYDWGMVTDLARRNQARLCGKLGVEHILISADIRRKRSNIRKNVLAWLNRPRLGTIPLFMAGDKEYFFYINFLMKQYNFSLSVVGGNRLEATRFKTAFSGIRPHFNDKDHLYRITTGDQLKMLSYYGKEYLLNPGYINSSLFETLDAFRAFYFIRHQNMNLFEYIPWVEDEVEQVLFKEYDWEIDPETPTTWRIGDGTTAFYNYIYYFVAGFSENDTFRSNEIREGTITRDEALQRAERENAPRWQSLQWYCDTIDIDFEKTIDTINRIETLY